jgi:hypothetical protein
LTAGIDERGATVWMMLGPQNFASSVEHERLRRRGRLRGVVEDLESLRQGDHVCWPVSRHDEFTSMTGRFVADATERGEQVVYLGWRGAERARRDLCRVDDWGSLLERRALRIEAVDIAGDGLESLQPARLVDSFRRSALDARRSGFAGLRLVGDATEIVSTPRGREVYLELDQRLERLMADGLGITAVCSLDMSALDESIPIEVACVHPATSTALAPFVFHASPGGRFRLAGEVDWWNGDQLERALSRVVDGAEGIEVDVSDLEFIDHRSLLGLDRWAVDHDCTLTLAGSRGVAARLAGLVTLDRVVVRRG